MIRATGFVPIHLSVCFSLTHSRKISWVHIMCQILLLCSVGTTGSKMDRWLYNFYRRFSHYGVGGSWSQQDLSCSNMGRASTSPLLSLYVYLHDVGEVHSQCSLLAISRRCRETYSWFWWEVGIVTNTIGPKSSKWMNETRSSDTKGKQRGFLKLLTKSTDLEWGTKEIFLEYVIQTWSWT